MITKGGEYGKPLFLLFSYVKKEKDTGGYFEKIKVVLFVDLLDNVGCDQIG